MKNQSSISGNWQVRTPQHGRRDSKDPYRGVSPSMYGAARGYLPRIAGLGVLKISLINP